ncbi:hypothetical protein VM1G_11868 [Cytospora mali]|uniref:Uncharacterized protein n=1 Tax=Cytospora mali TaxID=578113 RepID=A0A194W977_CYTMA|nr:hypothetical protein VM1G_11868 [Valsa mali]
MCKIYFQTLECPWCNATQKRNGEDDTVDTKREACNEARANRKFGQCANGFTRVDAGRASAAECEACSKLPYEQKAGTSSYGW